MHVDSIDTTEPKELIEGFRSSAFFPDKISKLERKIQNLERSNELKELSLSLLTHDLKNMLQLVLGYTQFAQKTGHTKYLKKVEEIIKRTNAVLENMRLHRGKTEHRNLYELLKSSAVIFDDKREITIQCENRTCFVEAFPNLENVFYNLIDNAVKYSEGRIEIVIEDEEETWKVCIKDYGKRVPRTLKDTLLDNQREGVGLTIVKQIVKLHNGSFWIEDNASVGSTSCISLPKVEND